MVWGFGPGAEPQILAAVCALCKDALQDPPVCPLVSCASAVAHSMVRACTVMPSLVCTMSSEESKQVVFLVRLERARRTLSFHLLAQGLAQGLRGV